MLSRMASEGQRAQEDFELSAPCTLWPVDLKLTHIDCNPDETLVHFQGQYLTICELDYNILLVEMQNAPKTKLVDSVAIGEFCLVEDVLSGRWYRGRVQNKHRDLFDVFLLDHGNILTVTAINLACASEDLFMLPPKIVCGFFANVLPLQKQWHSLTLNYFSSLIGSEIQGYIHGLLPHKVLILEAPAINKDLMKLNLGKLVDRDTFLLIVEMLTEVPLKQTSESVPDLLIEKQVGQEFSFRHSSLHGFENILSFCSPQLTVGKKERARITAAVKPATFYCQLLSMGKNLKEMSHKLSLACESESKTFSDKNIGNLGLLCAVKGKDEKWHRGFVQYLPVNSQVRVLFVDYGYCESVRVENILQLPLEFLSIPITAFPCTLSCLREKDDAILKKQLSILKGALLGDKLEIQMNSFNAEQNLYSVTLHAVSEDVKETKNTECDAKKSDTFYDQKDHSQDGLVQGTNQAKEHTSINAKYHQEIKDDSIFEGFVEHVLNPTNFWLRTEERNADFEDMMKDLTEYFMGLKLDEGVLENPVPGALCCAMYEKDMHYYRALVIDMIENGAEVYFIDFGNTEKVPHMLIKALPPKFALEPAFALKCSLSRVVPVQDVWTVSATDYFRQIVSGKGLLVHVVHQRKHEYVVDLYDRGNKGESIALLLTKAKMAEYWEFTSIATGPIQSDRASKGGKFRLTVGRNSKSGSESQLKTSVTLGNHKNMNPVKCSEMPALQVVKHESAEEQLQKKNTHAATGSFKVLTFKPGNELAVRCSQVNSPSDFWCQLQSKLSELEKLMEDIQYYYETHVVPWQPTEPCCIVKCPYDGRWYRGCILSAQDGEFDVILVDTGMIVTEKIHNLRAAKAEFLELEGQAFRCCLYDIKPRNSSSGVWHTNACKVLMQFVEVNSQNLKCTVYTQLVVNQTNLYNVVDLHTPYGTATKLLISAGLAREVQSPKKLTPSLYPYSFTYSLFNVNVGCKEQLYVTHVCSPWEIYCQLDKIGQLLEGLMKEVQKTASEMQSLPAAQGRLCLAKYFMDGQWYRGLAYPVQSSLHLNVFFVDYGNMQVVEKCNVLPIPRHATDLLFAPMLALKCCLSGVPKGEVLADVNGWLEKAVLNKLMEAKFVGKDDQGTLFFDLFDGSLHINQKVKDMIALHSQAGKASVKKQNENFLKTVVKTGEGAKALQCVGKSNGDNSVKAKNIALAHRSRLTTQRASVASMKSSKLLKLKSANSPREGELYAFHYRKHGIVHAHTKSRERSAVQNHKNKEECGHLKRVRSGILSPNGPHLPETKVKPGFKGIGFVSHVNTATNFYIQMEDDEQAILKMGEDLNEAGLKETMENVSGTLHAGDVIACEYEDDGAFYRAVAIDVNDLKLKVEFIDYGNEATVDIKSARILPRFFFAQPRLSIPCFVEKPHTFLSDASFALAVDGKRLEVEFIRQCGQQWAVRMEICGVSTSLHNTGEFSRSQEDTNPQETEGGLMPKDMTTHEKEGHRWCSDSLGVQMKEMPSTASEISKPCMERETSQNFLQRETVKAFPEVTSQSSAAVKNVSSALLLTKQKKCCRPMKSNMHATGKKQHIRESAGRKCEINSDKQLLRPFHHPGDEKNQRSGESLEPSVSCASIVHTPPERTCESSEGQTKHVSIPLLNITAGQTEDGELLSFSENGDFYFRLNKNSEELALLDTLIAEKGLKATTISKINIKEGLECLVKSTRNQQWYRAKVQNVTEGQCSVVLFDHGVVEVVPLDAILELCTELREIPKQTVLCQWKGPGCPIEGGFEVLKETLNPSSEQNIRLIFLLYSEFSQIWDIEILINGIHLLQRLRHTSSLKHSENNGTCSACPHCPVVDTCPVHEISFAQRLSLAPVELDFGHTGFAAAVTAPCEFSVVLEGLLLIMSLVATILETPQDFDSLPEALIVPGIGCLVKCETKKKWCRAEIIHVDGSSVVINLVDYGHFIALPYPCHGQLKRLPEELVRLPKVTYPCILRGVKPASMEIWTDEAVVFFQEHICQKSLVIYFRQYVSEAVWEVDIMSGGVNVAMELVDAGHATYIDSMLGLRLQKALCPPRDSQLKFIPRSVRKALKLERQPKPVESKEASGFTELEFDGNDSRQENTDRQNCQATDDSKNQMSGEGSIQDPRGQKGEDTFASEEFVTEGTMRRKLTEQLPGKRKCVQM